MGLRIISLYKLFPNQEYGVFDDIPYGVFIHPFYGGDNVHHLTLITDYDFRERLANDKRLIEHCGRTDIEPVEFNTRAEAELYAERIAFPGWEDWTDEEKQQQEDNINNK